MAEAAPVFRFVGVDLSASNAVVSSSTKEEPTAVNVAVNDVSNRSTPSAVGFDGNLRLIGEAADTKVAQCPKQIVTSVPAVLGDLATARANYERLGCLWNFTEDGKIGPMAFGGREDLLLHPAACLAALLQKLVSFAAGPVALEPPAPPAPVAADGAAPAPPEPAFELAASVPDAWGEAELSTLRAAVDILGWRPDLVHVLPYSAALATAYAQRMGQKLGKGEERRVVAFVDVGFSQSTCSVVAYTPPAEGAEVLELGVEALATAVAPALGTQSLCAALAAHVNTKLGAKAVSLASKRGARLLTALQKALKELSMLPDTTLALECFFEDEGDLKMDISRAQFEEVAQSQLQELAGLVRRALSEAGVEAPDVHSAELVGGGMRIPKVQALLSELFPDADGEAPEAPAEGGGKSISRRLRFSLDGASAVASGAAHFAAGRRALKAKWSLASQRSALADEAALEASREQERWIASVHSEEVRRLEKGNELESYIYEVRSWLSGPDRALLKPDVTEPVLEETSRWFEDAQYEPGTTLAMYEDRLGGLKRQLEEHGTEFFEKRRKEREEKDKFLDAEAEKERQRRHDCGMDADKDDRKMAKSERLKMALKNKEEGNTVFKAGNLDDAAARYQRALQHINKFYMLDVSPDEKAEADGVTLSVQLNLAQVFLKLAAQTEKDAGKDKAEPHYQKAKVAAEEALKVDAENVKARFRKASALEKLGDLDGASKEVKSALKTEPENSDLLKLKERLDKLEAAQNAKAKKMYGKMFG